MSGVLLLRLFTLPDGRGGRAEELFGADADDVAAGAAVARGGMGVGTTVC